MRLNKLNTYCNIAFDNQKEGFHTPLFFAHTPTRLTTVHFLGRICALLVHILNTHDAPSYNQELGGFLR
jgi:hypothetical protein